MIEALILTVEKQQEQIALLIGVLTDMKSRFETMTQTTTSGESNIETETQTPHCQTELKDTATQTKERLHNAETQTPSFDPNTPFSPSSLSFLKESKVDDTLGLETSHLNESEVMDSEEGGRTKRKCISPIEAPKPDPTSPTDSNPQLSFATLHESYSPTIEMDTSYTHSDFAVDYRDCGYEDEDLYTEDNPHESDPYHEEPSSPPNHLNPCILPGVGTPCILQAYFFSEELAQKMNATEIKETILKEEDLPFVCSVLQLNKPHGSHYIYIHTVTGGFKLPTNVHIGDIEVTLEEPRKRIARVCDCKEIGLLIDKPDPD